MQGKITSIGQFNLLKDSMPIALENCLKESQIQVDDQDVQDQLHSLQSQFSKLQDELNHLQQHKALQYSVQIQDKPAKELGIQHHKFESLLDLLTLNIDVLLVGPSGSGKTHAAEACSKALDLEFYYTGAIESPYKLTGFMNATGKYVSTEFRKAYENGGVFLFDELDASSPQALLTFNAALANNFMDFPDKKVQRHSHFYCIASANTYGLGANRTYIGRNQLDAASLDRFALLDWPYDLKLEYSLSSNKPWCQYVQSIRNAVQKLELRHLITMRASIKGAQLLDNELDRDFVERTLLWKNLSEDQINKIKRNAYL